MRASMCALASGIVLRGELIRIETAKISPRYSQIGPCRAPGTAQGEAARGRNHWRTERNNATLAKHPARKIEVFEKIKVAKTAKNFENFLSYKDRLVAEEPATQRGTHASECARAAKKPGWGVISARKTASDDVLFCHCVFDLFEGILRQSRISVKKQEHIAPRGFTPRFIWLARCLTWLETTRAPCSSAMWIVPSKLSASTTITSWARSFRLIASKVAGK